MALAALVLLLHVRGAGYRSRDHPIVGIDNRDSPHGVGPMPQSRNTAKRDAPAVWRAGHRNRKQGRMWERVRPHDARYR